MELERSDVWLLLAKNAWTTLGTIAAPVLKDRGCAIGIRIGEAASPSGTRRFARLALLIEKRARDEEEREQKKTIRNHEVERSEPGRLPRAQHDMEQSASSPVIFLQSDLSFFPPFLLIDWTRIEFPLLI